MLMGLPLLPHWLMISGLLCRGSVDMHTCTPAHLDLPVQVAQLDLPHWLMISGLLCQGSVGMHTCTPALLDLPTRMLHAGTTRSGAAHWHYRICHLEMALGYATTDLLAQRHSEALPAHRMMLGLLQPAASETSQPRARPGRDGCDGVPTGHVITVAQNLWLLGWLCRVAALHAP